ncbi:MAG: type I restriction enzyme HsdR N-terminal domain-containing protein [Armatimonadetes bacterium]|nr:type I restriction enzyme HsdR N-terminal domain-containing protein [Armatimonadota bacterium]
MQKIPKKVTDRIASKLKAYQSIGVSQRKKDVMEADTVTLVKDILADVFGYDKYDELTSEHQIRGTFCDLAIKISGKVKILVEVKSAGTTLNESHLRQVVNYGANQGVEWIVLTNAVEWRLYKIKFGQPVDFEEVSTFDFTSANARSEEDVQKLYIFCREGISTDAMSAFHQHSLVLNKFMIAQVALTEPIASVIKREMKKLFPDVKVSSDQITNLLSNEIFRREVIEGERAKETATKLRKARQKMLKSTESEKSIAVEK